MLEALVGLVQRPCAWPDPGDQLLAVDRVPAALCLKASSSKSPTCLGAGRRVHPLDDGAGLFETFGERPPKPIELPVLHPRCLANRLSSPLDRDERRPEVHGVTPFRGWRDRDRLELQVGRQHFAEGLRVPAQSQPIALGGPCVVGERQVVRPLAQGDRPEQYAAGEDECQPHQPFRGSRRLALRPHLGGHAADTCEDGPQNTSGATFAGLAHLH